MSTKQTLNLEASVREAGKHHARALRNAKRVPAIVYGPKTKPLNVFISEIDAVRYSKHGFENSIFTFTSPDSTLNGLKVLRKSIDIHPVSRRPVHMDFFAPDMTQTVRVNVEIRLTGKAIGTTEGGLVSQVRRDVEIECLPLEIPEYFELDISDLALNASMHISDLKIPESAKLITNDGETVATCAIIEEEVFTPAAAAAAPGAEGAAAAAPGAAGAAAPAGGAAAPAAGGAAPAAGAKK